LVKQLPSEVDLDSFMKLAEKADSCRVKRLGDNVKLKLRTPKKLYTFATKKEKAEEIIKKLKCKILEV
jgi:hypothetical protein